MDDIKYFRKRTRGTVTVHKSGIRVNCNGRSFESEYSGSGIITDVPPSHRPSSTVTSVPFPASGIFPCVRSPGACAQYTEWNIAPPIQQRVLRGILTRLPRIFIRLTEPPRGSLLAGIKISNLSNLSDLAVSTANIQSLCGRLCPCQRDA